MTESLWIHGTNALQVSQKRSLTETASMINMSAVDSLVKLPN